MFSEKIAGIKNKTDLIVLPEMFSTGFSMNAGKLAEDMDGSAIEWMRKTAKEKNCVITGSLIIKDTSPPALSKGEGAKVAFFNRLIWINSNGSLEYYDKRHLFSLSKEEEVFTAGKKKLVVELKGWNIRPLVCFDLRFPVWARNVNEEYDVLLYVANWPERRMQPWKYLLIARAIENQCYVVGVNRAGNDNDDVYYSGESMVVDPLGNVLYHKQHDEDVATLELNYDELKKTRTTFPFLKDADSFEIDPKSKIKSH